MSKIKHKLKDILSHLFDESRTSNVDTDEKDLLFREYREINRIDIDVEWEGFYSRIKRYKWKSYSIYIASAAACAIMCIGLLIFDFYNFFNNLPSGTLENGVVVLHTENGDIIDLKKGNRDKIDKLNSKLTVAEVDSSRICFTQSERQQNISIKQFTDIETKHGHTYIVMLPDGTSVTLGSNSRIRFSDDYNLAHRDIILNGEAFFDVKKNKEIPFIVSCNGINIKALGTSFYVDGSNHTTSIEAVLQKGKIEVGSYLLFPSQHIKYDLITKAGVISSVDVDQYTAWMNNSFVFRTSTIDDVFKQLSKWYDIESVHYEEESIKKLEIGASFKRYSTLDEVVALLNKLDMVHITNQNSTLYIKRNPNLIP